MGAASGPVHVDGNLPAVDQLWDEVHGVIEFTNSFIQQLLELFGVIEGNGLFPFAGAINSPVELLGLLGSFFKPPKCDKRGALGVASTEETEATDLPIKNVD